MRTFGVSILAFAISVVALLFVIGDLNDPPSLVSRIVTAVVGVFIGGIVVGRLGRKRWALAIICSWAPIAFGVLLLSEGVVPENQLLWARPGLVVAPALASLLGGFTGSRLHLVSIVNLKSEDLVAVGVYLLAGTLALLPTIAFIEGRSPLATATSFFALYFVTTGAACWYFPKLWKIAGFVVPGFFAISDWLFSKSAYTLVDLLLEPSLIDHRSYYILLPLVAILGAIAGSFVGFRLSKARHRKTEGRNKKMNP